MMFRDWTPDQCAALVSHIAIFVSFSVWEGALAVLKDGLEALSRRPGWIRARDAETMLNTVLIIRERQAPRYGAP